MSRHMLVAVIVVTMAGVIAAFQGPMRVARAQQQAPTFRSSTSAVMVDVSVRDRSRRTITNLEAADFTIRDRGVPQDVSQVSFGRLPIDVTVGLDISFSVTGPVLERLRRGVLALMGDLRKEDRLKLMMFNVRTSRSVDFTSDPRLVERAMQTAAPASATSLYDAISVALVSAPEGDRRQLVVFFTDGGDSTSTSTPDALQGVAQHTRATLNFVIPSVVLPSIGAPLTTVRPGVASNPIGNGVLYRLAQETGGSLLPVGASTDLGPLFRQILEEFRQTYVLFYVPKGVDRDGFHDLEVTVNRPGAVVQARRGYFGS